MHYLGGDADGQTPLDPDEGAQLLVSSVATRADLNIVEQENIARATQWAFSRRRHTVTILDEPFVRRLHTRMFGDVWRWAGSYRLTPRNIGVEFWRISEEVARLMADARFWVEHQTYESDELCVRLHHRLVFIHPFPNGNGRHARLYADTLAVALGREPLTWGRNLELEPAPLRAMYIGALRRADAGDFTDLLAFARA